jgi:OmpA-OmpF porin, OOP family
VPSRDLPACKQSSHVDNLSIEHGLPLRRISAYSNYREAIMRLTMLTTFAIALCSVAEAQNPARGWYVGFDVGMSQLDGDVEDLDNDVTVGFDDDSNTFTAHAGYRFNRFLQLDVFYAALGKFSDSRSGYALDVELRGIGVQFTGRIPISEKVGILAHLISMNRRLDVSARSSGQVPQSDYHGGIVHRWGLGVNYQFNHQWDLRLEHSHSSDIGGTLWSADLDLDLRANLRTTTLGVRYKFPR